MLEDARHMKICVLRF